MTVDGRAARIRRLEAVEPPHWQTATNRMATVNTSVTGPRCVRPASRNTRSNSNSTMAPQTNSSGRNCMEACIRTSCISMVFGSMKTSRICLVSCQRQPTRKRAVEAKPLACARG